MVTTQQIQEYVDAISTASNKRSDSMGLTLRSSFSFSTGRKYFKIIETNTAGREAVHCFVDRETGSILKAAGWNKPATGIRGNLSNKERPLLLGDFYYSY